MAEMMVAGARLEVARYGEAKPGRPTLVFLHEGLGSVSLWRDFPAALAAATGCPALAYSRQGYGRSDPVTLPRPLTFMHDEARNVLPALLDAAGINDAILVGHSDGASIALIYAGENGARLRGLALEAPHVFVEPVCVAAIAAVRESYRSGELRARLARHHGDNVDCAFYGWADSWLDPGFLSWNLESFLPSITVPVLVVQGEDDEYGTLAQVERICARVSGPAERLVLTDCGHAPHRDQRDKALAGIAAFVRRLL
ncbi:MAG TPA: alpha/beta hydrolase [Alphaproteobacteria bacterium]|nr:alpha/beta hydrolase [Alphaproteobacteria bacterium]